MREIFMGQLDRKTAFVTGAGSGIGKAAALALAAAGANIVVLSRTAEEIDETAAEIKAQGGKALSIVADTTDAVAMKAAVQQTVDTFGRLDIVVANAGINGVWAPIDDLMPDEWDQTMSVNLKGTYLTLHYAVPHMRKAGGSIIIISSINGTRTFTSPGASAYSVTKAGQLALAQQLALELGKDKIRVNAICPGAIESQIDDNTDQRGADISGVRAEFPDGDIPMTGGKPGKAKEVADLVVFLASDASQHITGSPIWIDGGQSLLR
jgi:NAD(P)-dependent dehydrogenase (short-subunit alcohol dehydrogenase family)